jgi:SAM-dependent methyltransferase
MKTKLTIRHQVARVSLQSILASPDAVREVSPGLFSTQVETTAAAPYDRKAFLYDMIVARSIYHRVFWGTSAPAYGRFGRAAIESARDGSFAEIGCGSLLFTSGLYAGFPGTSVVAADASMRMLRRAMKRLAATNGVPAGRMALLHSDVADLPFRSGVFDCILALNLLHVPCDADAISTEVARLLVPGRGRFYVSSLVRCGRWSDGWMSHLHRFGELSTPVSVEELGERVSRKWGHVESTRLEGNMCFMVVRHAG